MEIKKITVGELAENCYIISNDKYSLIIDPGDEATRIINSIKKEVVGILITHYHFDHIGALETLQKHYQVAVNNFNNPYFSFEVIKTPGHTADSLTFYFPNDNIMFTGDFLFSDTIGRMDLPTGSTKDMLSSLELISTYPSKTTIYPGHGPSNTLKESLNNIKKLF